MEPAPQLNPQYVTDKKGQKQAVILPIREYQELLDDLQDLAVVAERQDEGTVPHSNVVAELRKNGYLPD
jgi:hypothetical protein